jgi:hypothetical protein
VQRLEVDGVVCPGQEITIVNDGAVHMVRVVLGTTPP